MQDLWRRIVSGAWLAASLLVQTSASAAPAPTTASDAYNAGQALFQAHKCTEWLDLYAAGSVADLLATLPDQYLLAVDWAGIVCARQANQPALALKFANGATAIHDAPAQFWLARLDFDWALGKPAETIGTFEAMVTANPDALTKVNQSWLTVVNSALKYNGHPDLQKRLNAVFGAPGYHSADPGASSDNFRYAYAINELEAGHTEAAKAIFAQITLPSLLMRATLDPRLRAIVPPSFDARAIVERHLDAVREVAAAHPDDLGATFAVINDYSLLDQGAEMLAVLMPMRPGKAHPAIRASADDARRWWSAVARAYRMLGDYDNVIATWRQSMAPGEVSEKDAWVQINISQTQLQFGHAAAALATLAVYDKSTSTLAPQSLQSLHEEHGCAAWSAGKSALADADLAYLHQHQDNGPTYARGLALCMHRDDEAAASFIKDMGDPDKSPALLLSFSAFAPAPKTYPRDWYREGLLRLMMRADMKAAIAKAGGVGNFDVPPL